ncbi:MAG: hypothetical protein JSR68_08455 [Proteobacteria bacterium]|nr:hypothetical protein [Pseudomonadota bacterium]
MTTQQAIEYAAALLGVLGALLLAVKSRWSGWAFVLWLGSNMLWVIFGARGAHWGLVLQNAAFTVTSLAGIWVWLVLPRLRSRQREIDELIDAHTRGMP